MFYRRDKIGLWFPETSGRIKSGHECLVESSDLRGGELSGPGVIYNNVAQVTSEWIVWLRRMSVLVLSPLVNTWLDGSTYKTGQSLHRPQLKTTEYTIQYLLLGVVLGELQYFVVAVGLALIRRHLYNNVSLLLLDKHTEYEQYCRLSLEGRKYFVSLNHVKAAPLLHRFCVCDVQQKSLMFQLFVVFLSYLFTFCDVYSLEVHMEATLAIVHLISFEEIDPGEPIQYWRTVGCL